MAVCSLRCAGSGHNNLGHGSTGVAVGDNAACLVAAWNMAGRDKVAPGMVGQGTQGAGTLWGHWSQERVALWLMTVKWVGVTRTSI